MSSDKIDYIAEKIGSIDKTLEFQAQQLEKHIHRTELLEERFTPVEDHVKFVNGLLKAAVYISTVGGFIVGVLKLLRKF